MATLVAALAGLRLIWPVKPMRDESVAVAAIEPAPKAAPAAGDPAVQSPPVRADEGRSEPRGDSNIVVQPNGDTIEYQHGVKIIRFGAARQNQMSAAPAGGAAGPSAGAAISFKPTTDATDGMRVDASPPGALPSAEPSRTGSTAMPARPSPSATDRTIKAPRLALMVGGLGLDRSATADASTRLPPEVSFAFSPDGVDLTAQIMAARANGHEAILQLPMESRDGDKVISPSHVLTTNAGEPALLERLHWLLARATGYTGTINEGGDVFLADAAASSPVFKDLAAKGLFFVGNGTVPVGRVDAAAQAAVLPHGAVDVVIDLSGEAATGASLTRLKDVARLKGQALGYVPVLPSNPDQIARLAATLAAQAIRLVPVGALITSTPVADRAKRD